jgi:uncharacterized protein
MKTDPTYLGSVQRVVGSKVTVEISPALPSSSPIINGRVHRVGQIGSLVRVPLGFVDVFGIVSMVGAAPVDDDVEVMVGIKGKKTLEVQLMGEVVGTGPFQRGLTAYPTLDDEVHVVTDDDLRRIYSPTGFAPIEIGKHSTSQGLPITVDLDKLVTRHAAIVGSTGSGKSNSVAALLKSLTAGTYPSAQVVVIDPHGEYGQALKTVSKVFRIGDDQSPLLVPYWALSFDELAWFLVDRKTASEAPTDSALRDRIHEVRRESLKIINGGRPELEILEQEVTADSPLPFSIRQLWYYFDRKERVTYSDMGRTAEVLEKEGDADLLQPARFKPAGAGSSAPFKPQPPPIMTSYVNRILNRLRDRRFDFMLDPSPYDGKTRDLKDLAADWLNHPKSITVLDLGGVPAEVTDLVVGVVTRILFEVMSWGRDLKGIGRQRPLLIVFEEAHQYLPGGDNRFIQGYARRAVQRIFKEGRKYGVGGIVVSQRPSDLDETILSQCGTFISLRLTNSTDQGRIRSTVPDEVSGLIDLLPTLRTGEALVSGEAIQIPSRTMVDLVDPRPRSDDPSISETWAEARSDVADYAAAVASWRKQSPFKGKS